jgi:flagellar protein FliO/FliZ
MTATSYVQFVLALVFVLALIGVAAIVARRLGLGHAAGAAGRRRRLSVEEVLPLDGKRRLVLLRRDAIEHLVILGPGSETVVERGIAGSSTFAVALREQADVASDAEARR